MEDAIRLCIIAAFQPATHLRDRNTRVAVRSIHHLSDVRGERRLR
jgi:hypothetical protein